MIPEGLPAPLMAEPQPWMSQGMCRGTDPSIFVLEQGRSARKAKQFCDSCPVTQECLQYGRETGSVGVWGGVLISWRNQAAIQDARPVPLAPPKRSRRPTRVSAPIRMAARKNT